MGGFEYICSDKDCDFIGIGNVGTLNAACPKCCSALHVTSDEVPETND